MIGRSLAAGILALGIAAAPAAAQTYPTRPITMIVPYAAGGPSDIIARLVAQSMGQTLGQTVVIENVGGAGGTTGAARAARAAPDGYTILFHHLALAAGASLYRNLTYDTVNDFAPIGLINQGGFVVVSKNALETRTIADLLAYVKKAGRDITFGNAGVGSGSHMCNMMLQSALGVKFTEIPYRGTGPALNDLVGGQLDALCDQTTSSIPQIQAGRVRAYAVTSTERVAQLPDLPTLSEAGLPNFEVTVWNALYAPKGTPPAIIDRLYQAMEVALKDETILKRFADLGTSLFPAGQRGPEATRARLVSEVEKWRRVIAESGYVPSN